MLFLKDIDNIKGGQKDIHGMGDCPSKAYVDHYDEIQPTDFSEAEPQLVLQDDMHSLLYFRVKRDNYLKYPTR